MRISDWSSDVCSSDLPRRAPPRARRLQFGRHVGERELGVLEIGDTLPELLAVPRIGDRLVEAALRAAKRAGADVETAAVEPHHRDAEALAFGADPILRRHADRIEHHLRGRLRMPAEIAFLAADAAEVGRGLRWGRGCQGVL